MDLVPLHWQGQALALLSHRPKGGCGLRNVGNSCYMNSVLQALAHCPPLAAFCVGGWPDAGFQTADMKGHTKNESRHQFCRDLMMTLREMCGGQAVEISPRRVTESAVRAVPEFRQYGQQDAHEAFNYILNNLHDELFAPVPAELNRHRGVLLNIEDERATYARATAEYRAKQKPSLVSSGNHHHHAQQQQQPARSASPGEDALRQLKQPHAQSIVGDTFQTLWVQKVTCDTCGNKSVTVEEGFELPLSLPSKAQLKDWRQPEDASPSWLGYLKSVVAPPSHVLELEDCLRAYFTAEKLDGADAYFCDACNAKSEASKSVLLAGLPEVLCIHLKRFSNKGSWSAGPGAKNGTLVRFPVNGLDLRPYLHASAADAAPLFDLFAVVKHAGSASQGHYICCAKTEGGRWLEFDDEVITPLGHDAEAQLQTAEAYMLLYRKRVTAEQARRKNDAVFELATRRDDKLAYLARSWALRWESMTDPGPVDNCTFACEHGGVLHPAMKGLHARALAVSASTAARLAQIYGGPAPVQQVSSLDECAVCKLEWTALQERRVDEHRAIGEMDRADHDTHPRVLLLPMAWFNQWWRFIDNDQGPLGRGSWRGALPPGPIDTTVLLDPAVGRLKPGLKDRVHYTKVSQEIWDALVQWYSCLGQPVLVSALSPPPPPPPQPPPPSSLSQPSQAQAPSPPQQQQQQQQQQAIAVP